MPKSTAAGASDRFADQAEAVRVAGEDATPEEIDKAKQARVDEVGYPERADRRLADGRAGDQPAREAKQREAELVRDADGNVVGSSHPLDRVDGQPDATGRAERGETDDDVLREHGHDVPVPANAPTFDPQQHTVAEVNDHIERNPDDRDRVLDAERAGQGRKGILGE